MADGVLVEVLVIADPDDAHARTVIEQLDSMGVRTARWNLSDLRSVRHVAELARLALWIDDHWAQVTASTTVWWRRQGSVDVNGLDPEEAQLAVDEAPGLLYGPLMAAGVRWIDEPFVIARAETRWAQTVAVRGVRRPVTLQTNYSEAVSELNRAGSLVAKPVSGGVGIAPFVDILTADGIAKLTGNPTFLQEFVSATADLRVVTVAGRSWVWRRARASGVVDWRQVDPAGAGFQPHENAEVGALSIEIIARLHLTMGVSDWLETAEGPVFLETNPQGNFLFLPGAADLVIPVIARHLMVPAVSTAVTGEDGKWPSALHRVSWDLGLASKAPSNDGIVPPVMPRPDWIDRVAVVPAVLDVAKAANRAAREAAATAEAKATRMVQLGLAVLAFALALGAYQLTFDLARSVAWLPTLLPDGIAIACLILAIFEAGEIDRVGFYRETEAVDFDGVGPAEARCVQIEIEERGRALARWTARNKLSDLMQARAWLARGLVALFAAALLAGLCRGLSTSPSSSSSSTRSVVTTTTVASP